MQKERKRVVAQATESNAGASLRQREKRSRVGTGEYQMATGLLIKNESYTAAVESGHGQEECVELSLYRTHLETVSLIRK